MSRDARTYVLWRPTVTRVRVKYDARKEAPDVSHRVVVISKMSKGNIEEGTPASSKFPASITLRLPLGNKFDRKDCCGLDNVISFHCRS